MPCYAMLCTPGNLVADAASLNLLPLISASVIAGLCLPADGVILRGVDEILHALSIVVRAAHTVHHSAWTHHPSRSPV